MPQKPEHIQLPPRLTIDEVPLLNRILMHANSGRSLQLDFSSVEFIDSTAMALISLLEKNNLPVSLISVNPRLQNIMQVFSRSAPEKKPEISEQARPHAREKAKKMIQSQKNQLIRYFTLVADEFYHVFRYFVSRRGVYPGEIRNQMFFMGYGSYFIVSLICFLVGITIGITSAEQLNNFGANIFLADLMGFGMIRELVPLMTGIILAGKVGASITAEVSSMVVMEEVDALKTMGLNPEKFLMVPRLIAMTIAVPLLVALANFVGIFGGMLVGKFFSGIPFKAFYNEMLTIVGLEDYLVGLIKTMVFGWTIVISSGYKGFSVTRGAEGVGIATTESVVLSISLIIVLDCIFALLLY